MTMQRKLLWQYMEYFHLEFRMLGPHVGVRG